MSDVPQLSFLLCLHLSVHSSIILSPFPSLYPSVPSSFILPNLPLLHSSASRSSDRVYGKVSGHFCDGIFTMSFGYD
ncbi:hypothetical protein E2C01_048045 [Portunus trituberculatus]|uniref:Secreted protein n=1 Tax=Portunus trituberculatus TaxID=210409 RepID=A0A5B7GAH3_PORTR|nr:hypothetical protein [Portunus trituberculatus]